MYATQGSESRQRWSQYKVASTDTAPLSHLQDNGKQQTPLLDDDKTMTLMPYSNIAYITDAIWQ
jgi:hypothetical protein